MLMASLSLQDTNRVRPQQTGQLHLLFPRSASKPCLLQKPGLKERPPRNTMVWYRRQNRREYRMGKAPPTSLALPPHQKSRLENTAALLSLLWTPQRDLQSPPAPTKNCPIRAGQTLLPLSQSTLNHSPPLLRISPLPSPKIRI